MREKYLPIESGRNFAPNTVTWPIGSLVVHDCDAKCAEMLLRVKAYLPNGTVRAEYVEDERRERQLRHVHREKTTRWFDLADLHDPARFDIDTSALATSSEGSGERHG